MDATVWWLLLVNMDSKSVVYLRTCLLTASSVLKSSSSPRFLICSNNAVAIFMCVSNVALRAVSSGNCVMAVFK